MSNLINFVLFHCILQLIYHIMSFQAESPSSGKFTALSFYLVTSLLFLVGVFIESIFMLHLQQTNEERALIQNYLSKWKSLIGKRSNKNLSNDKSARKYSNNSLNGDISVHRYVAHYRDVNIKKVDFYAFCISGSFFFVFNIIYWTFYLEKYYFD